MITTAALISFHLLFELSGIAASDCEHREGADRTLKPAFRFAVSSTGLAQSTTAQGRVVDSTGAVVVGVKIIARHLATGVQRETLTDNEGNYQFLVLPIGAYRIEVHLAGFETQIVENLILEVGRSTAQDFQLRVGEINQTVIVTPAAQLVERTSISVGQMIDRRMVQEIPLNGRHFIDLGMLAPGSVTAPQGAPLATPARGQGSFGLYTAGNREDTVNYLVNGINLNDLVVNVITFLPPISSLQEFKIDNSTFSAEYGRNSGAVVNIATRSGINDYHGELIEFLRNDALDARNFFDFNSSRAQPFKRNQFGGSFGGPLLLPRFGDGGSSIGYNGKNQTFFFFSYEGLRQRQEVNLNSVVLSDRQRLSVTDPLIGRLVELIPRANFIDSSGASRYIGAASAPVDVDQWAIDLSHNLTRNNRLHIFYAEQRDERNEPTFQGNTVPGFGDIRRGLRQIFTLQETHVFNNATVNEARFGFNRIDFNVNPVTTLNPADFQIDNGIDRSDCLKSTSPTHSISAVRAGIQDETIRASSHPIHSAGRAVPTCSS